MEQETLVTADSIHKAGFCHVCNNSSYNKKKTPTISAGSTKNTATTKQLIRIITIIIIIYYTTATIATINHLILSYKVNTLLITIKNKRRKK
jgi:hypothetical protein